jgi:hypothetical protein
MASMLTKPSLPPFYIVTTRAGRASYLFSQLFKNLGKTSKRTDQTHQPVLLELSNMPGQLARLTREPAHHALNLASHPLAIHPIQSY